MFVNDRMRTFLDAFFSEYVRSQLQNRPIALELDKFGKSKKTNKKIMYLAAVSGTENFALVVSHKAW